jgi:S-DNA-T family DNA segregation ATPase FtsK/SpoIIIE
MGELVRFPEPKLTRTEPVQGELVDADHDGVPDTDHASTPGAFVERPDADPVSPVYSASTELVVREPITVSWRRLPAQAAQVVRASPRVVRTAATHDRTKTTVRHVSYVFGGVVVVARRVWDAKTNSRSERAMRAAEARGDWAMVAEWHERGETAKEKRHTRHMSWLDAPVKLAKALVIGCAGVAGLLLTLGIVLAISTKDVAQVLGPIGALFDLVEWISVAVTIAWGPIVLAAPWIAIGALWHVGRKAEATLEFFKPTAQQSTGDAPITPSVVVTALRDLGIPTLNKAIRGMEDTGASMLGLIRIAGCGVEVDVSLPLGVTTLEVQTRRRKLAENLGRHEHEVFITIPPAARTVRLWIADSGALDEPIGPSPLAIDPDITADLYTGRAPWGQDLRGDVAALALLQRHMLITGLSNQGKTAALRALVLWLALDRTVEFRIADLKGVGDWRMFAGLATTLVEGPTDAHVIAATEMLEAGVVEMERRNAALNASGSTDGVNRAMARSGRGFHPIFLVVDEAQQAFLCPAVGDDKRPYGGTKHTSRYFMAARKIHNQGRAVNVVLWQGTQDPTDQNLPKLVREGAHIRASLVVGTEAQARMALGDKAIDGGAAPHKLRQGLDKGTLVVSGDGVPLPPGESSMTIRTHFVDGAAAVEIAEHAKANRTTSTVTPDEDRDLLADVAAVMRSEAAVRAKDVAVRLRELAPNHAAYAGLTAEKLALELDALDVPVRKKDGYPTVRAPRVLDALAERTDDGA